jgi:N-methylhydantoinase B
MTTFKIDEATQHTPTVEVDPITYEVVRHKLVAIVEQQSAVLKNVSGSPLVFEANDCNTGLYLPDGEIVTMGPHVVFHSGSMELVVNHIVDKCEDDPGINEGDVFITNDPYHGALHLPDITMIEPVIYDGQRIGWVGSCCHVLDIGGMTPSSWAPDATQTYQEGLILPPTKLVAAGKVRSDVWRLILSASRLPDSLALDLKAMIAANSHARNGMIRLLDRYGVDTVVTVMRTMLDKSEQAVRERISELPDSTFQARSYFDHDGHESNLGRVAVKLEKEGDGLHFDFADTAEQLPGIYNCTLAGVRGGVFASVLPVLAPDIPWNSGVMRAIEISAPLGSIVNAKHPAPCGAATIGGSFMVKNVAHSAVSALASTHPSTRSEAMAESTGSIPVMHLGGLNQYGEGFGGAVTEALSGGGGALEHSNGIDVAGPHEILEYKYANVEKDEATFPLIWLRRELGTDGAGAGRHRGGNSLSSSFTVHDAGFVHAVLMCHSLSMPTSAGLHGGLPGSTHQIALARDTNIQELMTQGSGVQYGKDASGSYEDFSGTPGELMLTPGDVIDWSFHGGGGWGDPISADPAAVLRDVEDQVITADTAKNIYGVVVAAGQVDETQTTEQRQRIRDHRKSWSVDTTRELPEIDGQQGGVLVGDVLMLQKAITGDDVFACSCSHVLSYAHENWKLGAARGSLDARDLGQKIRLHPGLVAEGFGCPSCGTLLTVEVRAAEDDTLNEVTFPVA